VGLEEGEEEGLLDGEGEGLDDGFTEIDGCSEGRLLG